MKYQIKLHRHFDCFIEKTFDTMGDAIHAAEMLLKPEIGYSVHPVFVENDEYDGEIVTDYLAAAYSREPK